MRLLLICLFAATTLVFPQNDESFPIISNADIENGTIEQTKYYDGNSLWGLINGGADIYLEYGFDKLAFQTINWQSHNFRIEIYRMDNNKSAFGIFSVSRYKCDINDTLTRFICITPYQVQAAHGRYYISLSNEKGTQEAMGLTINIFEKILSKTDEALFELPEVFNNEKDKLDYNRLKFIKGELGVQNGFSRWYDLFADFSGYEFYVCPVLNDNAASYMAQISFTNKDDADKFVKENFADDSSSVKFISETEFILTTNP